MHVTIRLAPFFCAAGLFALSACSSNSGPLGSPRPTFQPDAGSAGRDAVGQGSDDATSSSDDAGDQNDAGIDNNDAGSIDAVGFPDSALFPDATTFPDAMTFPDATVPDTGPFTVAPHPPLVQVPNNGGPRLLQPQLVVITFPNDPNVTTLEMYSHFIVTSTWLRTVGMEYGIQSGSVTGVVHSTTVAPATVADGDVQTFLTNGLQNHSIPTPAGGNFADTLYVVIYPPGTTIQLPDPMGGPPSVSCQDFGGYHESVNGPGPTFSYAVIPNCHPGLAPGLTDLESQEIAISHELIEAATDATPDVAPGYALTLMGASPSPWALLGSEIGDLCAIPLQVDREGMYVAQRIYSNAAAATGTEDPCIPANPAQPFYTTMATPDAIQAVSAGSVTHFNLTGWSTAPVPDWTLQTSVQATQGFNPSVQLTTHALNNGGTATLTVTVPAGTPAQSAAEIILLSAQSTSDFHVTPIVIVVQ
jgi:hypothetical protein